MPSEQNRPITDLGTLKALAHPLRMQLYRGLFVARVATASQLAEQVDEAVSLVSYHLRKLAEHGLIEEAEPQSGDGRERWWQPASRGRERPRTRTSGTRPSRPPRTWRPRRLFHEQRADMYRRYLDERADLGRRVERRRSGRRVACCG